jgi:hypothetical protein
MTTFFYAETTSFLKFEKLCEYGIRVAQASLGLSVSLSEEALFCDRCLRVHEIPQFFK